MEETNRPSSGRKSKPILERFWSRVELIPFDNCWHWIGGQNNWGYGVLNKGGKKAGNILAHQLSYEVHKGDRKGLCVLHKCDVRTCVNPYHLFLGTRRENMLDMWAKGRGTDFVYRTTFRDGKRICPHGHEKRLAPNFKRWYCPLCIKRCKQRAKLEGRGIHARTK